MGKGLRVGLSGEREAPFWSAAFQRRFGIFFSRASAAPCREKKNTKAALKAPHSTIGLSAAKIQAQRPGGELAGEVTGSHRSDWRAGTYAEKAARPRAKSCSVTTARIRLAIFRP